MADFPGLPENPYEYENRFNYSVWTPNTIVHACNVPWDATYRDVVRFDTDGERDEWFASRYADGYSFTLNGMVYLRYGEPVRVNAPFDVCCMCNYLVVENPTQPVPGSKQPDRFYYFVNDVKYIAPNTTQLNVQLDVWMTYYDRLEFGFGFVDRGHAAIANNKSTLYNLADYLTDPEGLDIGAEYEIVDTVVDSFVKEPPYIVIMSNANLESGFGTVSSPTLTTAKGSINDGMPSGASCYACDANDFLALMQALQDAPWVSQCITMVTVVPKVFAQVEQQTVNVAGVEMHRLLSVPANEGYRLRVDDVFGRFDIPKRFKNLKKFFTYPYTTIEMTAYNGGEIALKPECLRISTEDDGFNVISQSILAPPEIRGYVWPLYYNSGNAELIEYPYYLPSGDEFQCAEYNSEMFDMALQFNNFPQFSLVNNQYINYIASNRNMLNYQFEALDWSQQKALTAAQLSYDQSTANMNNAWANQQIANQANWDLSNISQAKNLWSGATSVASATVGALGNFASGNTGAGIADVANAGLAVANTALNADWINRTTATQVGAATSTAQNNIANQGYMRDTNYDYAVYAAKGDYQTAVQGVMAKVQDAKLTQPTTSGQNGGDAFNFVHGYMGIRLKFKRLKYNQMRQIGDYWLRYGYYVNRWLVPPQDLACMENFTYWRIKSLYLTGADVPELFKEAVRGIFEKGVTVWRNPDHIGHLDMADNDPLTDWGYY